MLVLLHVSTTQIQNPFMPEGLNPQSRIGIIGQASFSNNPEWSQNFDKNEKQTTNPPYSWSRLEQNSLDQLVPFIH